MGRIRRYFDRISKGWAPGSAVLSIISFSLLCCSGINHIVKSQREGDQSSFYWGIGLVAVSLFFILWCSLVFAAIVRRHKAELQRDV
jgi:hypothetical protein